MTEIEDCLQKGVQAHTHGNVQEAIDQYQCAIEIDKGSATAHNNIGFAYGQIKEWQKARFHLEEAIRLNPQMANAHANLGQILAAQGKTEAALRSLAKAIELETDNPEHWNNLARIYFVASDFQQAEYAWHRALGLIPDDADIKVRLATAVIAQNRFNEAHRLLDEVINRQPNYQPAWAQKGVALFLEQDYGSAKKCLETAWQLNSSDYVSLKHLALLAITRKDNAQAYQYLKLLCEQFPEDTALQVDLAVVELSVDKKTEAKDRLCHAAESLSDSRTLYYKAVGLKETGGEFEEISELLKEVMAREDEYSARAKVSLEMLRVN